jgi:hypothetical protein
VSSPESRVGRRLSLAAVASVIFATLTLLLALSGRASAEYANCPNEALRNGPSANLGDCRAYELVSPPDKNGGQVDGGVALETEQPPWQATPDGEAVTYGAQTTFTEANPESSMATTQYLARRSATGWTSRAITPKQFYSGGRVDISGGSEDESLVQGFSEDLSTAFLVAAEPALAPSAPAGYYNPYLRREDGSYELLSSVTPPLTEQGPGDCCSNKFNLRYAGMTKDAKHVLFMANDALVPHAIPGQTNLYESSEGQLELINVLPTGETFESNVTNLLGKSGYGFGGPDTNNVNGEWSNFDHAISEDGSRVFWTTNSPTDQVYMRERTATGARTVEISASQKHEPGPELPSHYWVASADGSLVYFSSCAQLTDDSTAQDVQGSFGGKNCGLSELPNGSSLGQDLYRYNVQTGQLTDLTVDSNSGETAEFKGLLGASEDGSYLYYVAHGVLAPGATTGLDNLYLWHDGQTTFIASIGNSGGTYGYKGEPEADDWNQSLANRTSRVTPDGLHVAFESFEPLTGYDNHPLKNGACYPGVFSEANCREVFEYSASRKTLVCGSCRPSGLPPEGNSATPDVLRPGLVGNYKGWQTNSQQQRYLSDDGSRLFFVSEDAILPQASDGRQNVYEYEQDGAGNCQTPTGCVSLLSTGTSDAQSYFVEASADGSNAFIVTGQSLLAQDGDEAQDLYDVRVGGGFEKLEAPSCAGEACRSPITPAPAIYGTPPSATFVGAGNPGAPAKTVSKTVKKKVVKCPKGKKRSHGKCVKAKKRAKARKSKGKSSNAKRRSK